MSDKGNEFLAAINEMGDIARAITLKYFRQPLPINEKDDRSPVTAADQEIEQALRHYISKNFPGHGVIGEEYGADNADADCVWVIDPIDGTRAFMTGKPLFGTIIGLMQGGKPHIGLLDQGFTNERWIGVTDKWATHNGKAIHVSSPRALNEARMFIGSPNMFGGKNFEAYVKLCHTARWPQYGCDCYAYGLLAMGWADLVMEQCLKLHDVIGLSPIVTGAGGYMGNWHGDLISADFDGAAVAASSRELAMEAARFFGR